MTADRTPIRRWLAIGSATHRPPGRRGKTRHRFIVAPLAATIAATAAVSVGVALARAGSERRSQRRREEVDGSGPPPVESLAGALRRMAVDQTELAIGHLRGEDDTARAVHEARKSIKRIRAIVRLLEGELGGARCRREQIALRDAAARLAGARDAEVMLMTLDSLVRERSGELAGRKGVVRMRAHLHEERELAARRAHDGAARMLAAEELHAFRLRAIGWQLPERGGAGAADVGARRIYRQGRRRYRGARKAGGMHTMHQWRKRVKDLRYVAESLRRARRAARPASAARPSSKASKRDEREDAWLARLAHRADALGEVLGEEHDLAVLGAWLRTPQAHRCAGPRTRRRLRRAIARRRAQLRGRALREGKRMYRRKPARFVARLERAYDRR